jgi:hypothetical protein
MLRSNLERPNFSTMSSVFNKKYFGNGPLNYNTIHSLFYEGVGKWVEIPSPYEIISEPCSEKLLSGLWNCSFQPPSPWDVQTLPQTSRLIPASKRCLASSLNPFPQHPAPLTQTIVSLEEAQLCLFLKVPFSGDTEQKQNYLDRISIHMIFRQLISKRYTQWSACRLYVTVTGDT